MKHLLTTLCALCASATMLFAETLYQFPNNSQLASFKTNGSGTISWSSENGVSDNSGRLNMAVSGSQTGTLFYLAPVRPGENGLTLSCFFKAEAYSSTTPSRIGLGLSSGTSTNLSTDGGPLQGRLIKNGSTFATLEVRGAIASSYQSVTGISLVSGNWYKLSVTFIPRASVSAYDIVARLEDYGADGNSTPTLVGLASGMRTQTTSYFDGANPRPLYPAILAQNDGGGASAIDDFRMHDGLSDSLDITGAFSSSQPGNLFTPGQALALNLSLDAPLNHAREVSVKLIDSTETTVASSVMTLPANQARPVVLPISFPAQNTGFYRIEASAANERLAQGTVGVLPASSNNVPNPDSRFGIVAHLKDRPNADRDLLLDIIRRINIGWIREGFLWHQIQPAESTWNWTRYDDLVTRAGNHGINVLPVLGFTAEWASTAPLGTSIEAKRNYAPEPDAWSAYVSAVTARYKDRIGAWEVWNEPNATTFWKPVPDPYMYSLLLSLTCDLVKEEDPNAILISAGLVPQTGTFPSRPELHEKSFVNNMTAQQPDLDCIGYHPYTAVSHNSKNELYETRYNNILSQLLTPAIEDMPLWFTELGTSTIPRICSEKRAADYLTVILLKCLAHDTVEKMFIYNLRDLGTNPEEKEHMFGLINQDNTPKPALFAIRHLIEKLETATFVERSSPQAGVTLYTFSKGDSTIHVAWTNGNVPINLSLPISASSVILSNVTGQQLPANFGNGVLQYLLTPSPVYIEYSN